MNSHGRLLLAEGAAMPALSRSMRISRSILRRWKTRMLRRR
jgi:hypothetical protein